MSLPAGVSESRLQPWQRAQLERRVGRRATNASDSSRIGDPEATGYRTSQRQNASNAKKRLDAHLALQAAARRKREYEAATSKEGYYFDGVTRLNKVSSL